MTLSAYYFFIILTNVLKKNQNLTHTSRINHNFIIFTHDLDKMVNSWPDINEKRKHFVLVGYLKYDGIVNFLIKLPPNINHISWE